MDNSRKYTSLTIQQRIEILIKIQEGQSKKDILKEYKIAQSTLFKIEKNKAKLLNYLDNTESDKTIESKKRIRVSNYEKTSKLLYNWYLIKNTSGFNVKLSDFKLKALKINDKINGPKEFQCSNGWIDRFKEKYDIEIPVKKEEDRLTVYKLFWNGTNFQTLHQVLRFLWYKNWLPELKNKFINFFMFSWMWICLWLINP